MREGGIQDLGELRGLDILPVQRRGPLGSLVVDPDVAEPPLCRTIEGLTVD